jgi:ketose-bisphosphate aldolase
MKIYEYFKKAQKEKWAIGQFNFSTLEQLKAIIQAAEKLNSPVILGTSEGESSFVGLRQAVALVNSYAGNKNLALFLNLDHGSSFDYIKEAIDAGYDLVHFDGSKLGLKENIESSKKIAEYAHKKGVLVEGEINVMTGSSRVLERIPETIEENLTDPNQALEFIEETGVDSLAVSIGSFHGMEASGQSPVINFHRLKEISDKAMQKFLVLHGGSGIAGQDIKKAIKHGIVKININTELRLAYTNSLKQILKDRPQEIVPYKLMPEVIGSVQKIVEQKIKLFSSQNKK